MSEGKTSAALQSTTMLLEQAYCWELHLQRLPVDQVAKRASEHFGKSISTTTAWRRIEAQRIELREKIRRMAEDERDVELANLDRREAQVELALKLTIGEDEDGSPKINHAAFAAHQATLLRISERRAKLLGLDAPSEVTVSGTIEHVEAVDVELARLLSHVPAKVTT